MWNDDGTLQELGLCGECEDKVQCVLCSKWEDSATMSYDDAVGEHSCCDCDPKGDILLGEEEDDGARCDICCGCGKFTETGNVCECGGGHRELCDDCKVEKYPICEICADECVDYDDKLCHGCYHKSVDADECWCASAVDGCLTDRARDALKRFAEEEEEATTEFARNKICDECGCKGGCEASCVYVCGEQCEICGATPEIADDWDGNSVCDECFMCCEECYNTKNPAVFEKTASDLCECEEEDEQTCDGCGTSCLDHTSNKGRGSESPCEECEETRCKLCPCACEENQLLEEFWDGGMKEMWGEELREGHPLWEPFKLYKAMKKEQDA